MRTNPFAPHPFAAAALVSAALILAWPHGVRAQTQGDITITVSEIADGSTVLWDTSFQDNLRPYNADHCAASDTVTTTFTVRNLPAGTTFVDAWLAGTGVDCSTSAARQTGDGRLCVHLASDPTVQTIDGTIVMSLAEMVDPDSNACETSPAQGQTLLLWLFATGSTESTGEVTPAQFGYTTFTIDASPPSAPAADGATMVSGDNAIPINWTGGSEANLEYNVYVDTSVTDCTTGGAYAAGDPAPNDPFATGISGTSYSVPGADLGLAVGDAAQVFVTTVDLALNESVLSEAFCITRVETVGFCDELASSGSECSDSCAVRPGPKSSTRYGALLMTLALVLGAFVVRRKTRR